MKTTSPLVSWGIPVYNGGKTLATALESLAAQTYQNLEIIISDNASTDSTQEQCESFCRKEPRAKYIRQPQNIGATRNFSYVLHQGKGDYFLWGAHDDFWDKNYIEALVNVLGQHPEAILITPRIKHVDEAGQPSKHKDDRPAPGTSRVENLRYLFEDHSCSWIYGLFKRDWICKNFLDIQDIYGGDLIWMVETILHAVIAGSDQTCMYKRAGKNGFIPKSELDHLRCWRVLERHLIDACTYLVNDPVERAQVLSMTRKYISRKSLSRRNPLKYLKRQTMKSWLMLTEPAPVTQTKYLSQT